MQPCHVTLRNVSSRSLFSKEIMSTDEEEIRQVVTTWMSASKSGDYAKVLSLMSDDVIFLMPGRPPMNKRDFAAGQAAMDTVQFEGQSEIREIKVIGEWAWMWTKLTVTVTPKAGGASMKRSGTTLSILQKQNGKWVLVRDANMLAPVPA